MELVARRKHSVASLPPQLSATRCRSPPAASRRRTRPTPPWSAAAASIRCRLKTRAGRSMRPKWQIRMRTIRVAADSCTAMAPAATGGTARWSTMPPAPQPTHLPASAPCRRQRNPAVGGRRRTGRRRRRLTSCTYSRPSAVTGRCFRLRSQARHSGRSRHTTRTTRSSSGLKAAAHRTTSSARFGRCTRGGRMAVAEGRGCRHLRLPPPPRGRPEVRPQLCAKGPSLRQAACASGAAPSAPATRPTQRAAGRRRKRPRAWATAP
mmetsp:Transcript_37228/g.109918  ORF Transcript_37228/g.109918 Transcript_37228/m.109918 type:complete len:265 (+) Transcript_37228:509-1303(+)